jgi:hypothetical protein
VAGAAARRLDRHRVRGRHHHVLRRSPRPRHAVRTFWGTTAAARRVRAGARPVRVRPAAVGAVRQVPGRPGARKPGRVLRTASARCRRARGRHPQHVHPRARGAARRLRARACARDLSGRAGGPIRRRRSRERRPARQLDAGVLARAGPAARVRAVARLVPRGRDPRSYPVSPGRLAVLRARLPLAPHAPRPHPRSRGRGRHGALPAGGDARRHQPGLRADGPRQGVAGTAGAAGACAPQRLAPDYYAVRAGLPLPLHRGGSDRDGVRLARDGPARRERNLPARLPGRDRCSAAHERDGGIGQSDRRRVVCHGRPTDPGEGA